MTAIVHVGRSGLVNGPSDTAYAPRAAAPALTEANPPSIGGIQDALAMLYLALSQLRDEQVRTGQSHVAAERGAGAAALSEKRKAEARAEEAAKKGGLFDGIAKDVGVGGAVGLVTFNYALVAADVAAHKLGLLQNVKIDVVDAGALATGRAEVLAADLLLRKLDVSPEEARGLLERVGIPRNAPGVSDDDVKPVAKKLIVANMIVASLAATVLSCGTTAGVTVALTGLAISSAGSYVADHAVLDKTLGAGSSQAIGLGMEIYGAAASAMSGFAPGGAVLPTQCPQAAGVIAGAWSVAKGTDQVVTAVHQYEADQANVDAEAARQALARVERFVDLVIDGLREVRATHEKTQEILQKVVKTLDDSHLALAHATRG